jgi:microcystin-dependent protein
VNRNIGDTFLWTSNWGDVQGCLRCDGANYSASEYGALAAALGVTPSDAGEFPVPDLTGSAPTDLMPYVVARGTYPSDSPVPTPNYRLVDDHYLGEVIYSGDTYPPSGWALCDGSLLPLAQNVSLFSLIGITFGGDGKKTFALPTVSGAFIALTGIYPSRD